MILSGVGLVAKIKAEKSKKQKDGEKKIKGTEIKREETDFCEQCQIEVSFTKYIFYHHAIQV